MMIVASNSSMASNQSTKLMHGIHNYQKNCTNMMLIVIENLFSPSTKKYKMEP